MTESASQLATSSPGELVPVDQVGHEIATLVRSSGETLSLIEDTADDLYHRIKELPDDLPADPNNEFFYRDYDGRGVFIGLKKSVVEIGEDDTPKKAKHWYEVQVHSEAEDRSKPFMPGEGPYSVTLVAETDSKRMGIQFRCVGSDRGREGPKLRAMNGMTELKADEIQSGVDAILAELSDEVGHREELARSLGLTSKT